MKIENLGDSEAVEFRQRAARRRHGRRSGPSPQAYMVMESATMSVPVQPGESDVSARVDFDLEIR